MIVRNAPLLLHCLLLTITVPLSLRDCNNDNFLMFIINILYINSSYLLPCACLSYYITLYTL